MGTRMRSFKLLVLISNFGSDREGTFWVLFVEDWDSCIQDGV